jgi:hypothetical protein
MQFQIYKDEEYQDSVCADDPEEAAMIYAERYNSNGDHKLMDNPIEIEVISPRWKSKFFQISAETQILYFAEEVVKESEGKIT